MTDKVLCSGTGSYDLVPDKTLKRYKVAKNHRIVPFKTFSRDGMTCLVVHEQKFGIDTIKS